VFEHRVANHFRHAGWSVDDAPPPEVGADLLLTKGRLRKAVLVRADEPPGRFELARFVAACKRAGLVGIVVAPDDPVLFEFCDQSGLEFVPGETIGEVVVVGRAPPPSAPRPVAGPVPLAQPVPATPQISARNIPWWRWAIVALIWAAALAALAYNIHLYTGG
jgi:hypothetical protein